MKRISIPVLIMSLLLVAHSTFAQSPSVSDRNLIVTEGMAEVTGQNDSAKISISIVTEGRKLEAVSIENSQKTKAVLKAVNGLNIKNIKLKTSNYRVVPQKDYKARPPKIRGYEVYNGVEVILEGFNPELLSRYVSQVIGKSLESGANNIQHIQFYIKNREELEMEALAQATQKAIEKIRVMAKTAGVKLKGIVLITTQPNSMPPRPQLLRTAGMKAEAAEITPPIEIGESRIQAQVRIAYEIE